MEEPLFSVICAARNCEKYIKEAVNSVLNQTYNNWEMIILDDQSDDNTFSIASQFHDPRIKVFKSDTRLYCSSAYRKLTELANGEFCGILDGDDALTKNAIETIVRMYRKYSHVDFIYTQSWWCNEKLTPKRKGLSSYPLKGILLNSGQRMKHCFSHWRTFKTELRDKSVLFPPGLTCAVDKAFGYLLEEVALGGYYSVPLYYYRYHRENMSHHLPQKRVWKEIIQEAVNRRVNNKIRVKGIIEIKG